MKRFLLAVVLSGVPSTVHALMTGDDLTRATRAAGSLVGGGARTGIVVHLVVSAFWAVVLTRLRVRGVGGGVAAGLVIALLDLECVGRHNAQIRALPRGPQWLDHVAFGVLMAAGAPRSGQEQGRQAR
ncbi:hypothetical protein JNUCC0626_17570 [Lentzea sp. JNUCC 0626]|uniref:hypothetical protein n=1 Tax=Lentzea sp. JNUCC 0626 TaxID=3367513 RepID=UPI003749ECB0